jgi:GAF domain-containing protein
VESFVNDTEIVVNDQAADDRWPAIMAPVLAAGVRSVLGVPTRLGGGPVGSLNVYGDAAREWDESERAAIQSFNAVIEAQITSALALRHHGRVVEQLQYALENRVTIERAIGMLMARHDLDAVAAFHLLRGDARTSRRKVALVAREIVEGTAPKR